MFLESQKFLRVTAIIIRAHPFKYKAIASNLINAASLLNI